MFSKRTRYGISGPMRSSFRLIRKALTAAPTAPMFPIQLLSFLKKNWVTTGSVWLVHIRGIVAPYRDAPPPNLALLFTNEQFVISNRFIRSWTCFSGKLPNRAPPPANEAKFSRKTVALTSRELFSVLSFISTWKPPPHDALLFAKTHDWILMWHPLAFPWKYMANPPPRLKGSFSVFIPLSSLVSFSHIALFLIKWQFENS